MAQAEPLEYAIQMEQDGQKYYSEAAARTANPLGKKMFEALAADERRHEEVLREIAQAMDVSLPQTTPKQRLVTIFASLGDELKAQLSAEADDNCVIEKAIEMEKRSIKHYATQADASPNESHRSLYARLADEERQHVEILQNTLTYLNDTGHWFLWDEQAILDGG